jgi:protein-tyrosine phosphatase
MAEMKAYPIWPDQIYQRGEFRKRPLADKLAALDHLGVTVVVNVSPNEDEELAGKLLPCGYIHTHIPDSAGADMTLVEATAEWAVARLRQGARILVHCHAGRNRSSLVSAILLMELHGLTGQQAVDHVRRVRPNALATEAFVEYLLQRPSSLYPAVNQSTKTDNRKGES